MEIHQSETYMGENWWNWAVWIEGPAEDLDQVEAVEWRLHPSFPEPIRRSTDRTTQFRLETGGWGVFPLVAVVRRKDGQQLSLRHYLQLHFPDGTANNA